MSSRGQKRYIYSRKSIHVALETQRGIKEDRTVGGSSGGLGVLTHNLYLFNTIKVIFYLTAKPGDTICTQGGYIIEYMALD